MSKAALMYGLQKHYEGMPAHQRAGHRLAEWALGRVEEGHTELRVKTGQLGLLDTPYERKAYNVAGVILRETGLNVEIHRYSKDRKTLPLTSDLFDIIHISAEQEMAAAVTLPQGKHNHIEQLYPSEENSDGSS